MIKPMLATNGDENILDRENFIFEPKLDGIRAICVKKDNKLNFFSRNGIKITNKYPEFDFLKNIKAKECILDGEIVIYDKEGNPSFALWQERNSETGQLDPNLRANYVVFDILFKDGKDLVSLPLEKRKEILKNSIKEDKRIQISISTKDGKKLWKIAQERKLEGIIAKNLNSVYEQKRSDNWIKLKLFKTIECIVLGYTVEKRALTSLALGIYHKSKLIFCGKVGTGFDENSIKDLKNKLDKIKIEKKNLEVTNEFPDDIIPTKPELVAEIKYFEVTKDKKFRAPVFLRLREDKEIEECVLE